MNGIRVLASVMVAASLLVGSVGLAPKAKASPDDWTVTTTWDLRPWGGVDYGVDVTMPGADARAMVDSSTWAVSISGGILAVVSKFTPAGIPGTAAVGIGFGALQYCVQGETTTFHVAAFGYKVEKPGYTVWDRILMREQYETRYQWMLWGCSKN